MISSSCNIPYGERPEKPEHNLISRKYIKFAQLCATILSLSSEKTENLGKENKTWVLYDLS